MFSLVQGLKPLLDLVVNIIFLIISHSLTSLIIRLVLWFFFSGLLGAMQEASYKVWTYLFSKFGTVFKTIFTFIF